MNDNALRIILARLSENSTWRGIVLILTALGAVTNPEHGEAIVQAGLLIAGMLAAIMPDQIKRKTPEPPHDDGTASDDNA